MSRISAVTLVVLLSFLKSSWGFSQTDAARCIRAFNVKDYITASSACLYAAEQGDSESQNKLGNLYYNGYGVKQDYKEAELWYLKADKQGNIEATINIGNIYFIKHEISEALKWYLKAASQNLDTAQHRLGIIYLIGEGVKKDAGEALSWFRKAADQGYAPSQFRLGYMYYNGIGIKQDYAEAIKWLNKAADQNDADAQIMLGAAFAMGYGVEVNYFKAIDWYRKAAEQGSPLGQYALGSHHESGSGVNKDLVKSVEWYRMAAEQGYVTAQFRLGNMYEQGLGTSKDVAEAFKWYLKAAEQGNANAQVKIGIMYELGLGAAEDITEAIKWYRKAVDQGLPAGFNNLGTMYLNGKGVAQDYSEALRFYQKAADKGYVIAFRNIGTLYENGWGVKKDLREAIKLYQKASDSEKIPLKIIYTEQYINTSDESLRFLNKVIGDSQTHKDVVDNLNRIVSKRSNKFNVDNLRINFIIYDNIRMALVMLESIYGSVTDEITKQSATYSLILARHNVLQNINQEIYNHSVAIEEKKFRRLKVKLYRLSSQDLFYVINSSSVSRQQKPLNDHYYSLDNMVVKQSVADGILFAGNSFPGSLESYYTNNYAFLQTGNNFVDGDTLNGVYAVYTGSYRYSSFTGIKNVHAFKQYVPNKNQVFNGKQFYFYPEITNYGQTLRYMTDMKSDIMGK